MNTDIRRYTHTPSRTHSPAPTSGLPSLPSNIDPLHLKSPHILLYFFHGPKLLLLTIPLPDRVPMENRFRHTKEFKTKHEKDHFSQTNRSNQATSAKETKAHPASVPG